MATIKLQDFCFWIPFKGQQYAQKLAIQRIHKSRLQKNSCFVGEVKLTDRLTIQVLCYFLSVLACTKVLEEQAQTKTVQVPISKIFFLTKTQFRKEELIYISQKLIVFLAAKLPPEASNTLKNDVKLYCDPDTFQRTAVPRTRRLIILTSKQYIQHQLQIRQLNFWNKHLDPCLHIDFNKYNHFHKVLKKVDYLFVETNDLEGLLDDVFTLHLSELHIYRAGIECNKLQRFYNFRFDSRAKANALKVTNSIEIIELKEGNSNIQIRKEVGKNQKKKGWCVEDYDLKFKDLCKRKQSSLSVKAGQYATGGRLQNDFLQCFFLMHLQTILYLCNYLMVEYTTLKVDETRSAEDYLKHLSRSTHLDADAVKKLRRILLNFTSRYPPRIKNKQLSTFYLEQVLNFFQKMAVWCEIFDPVQIKAQEHHHATKKFMVLQYVKEVNFPHYNTKAYKQQHTKLLTFDKKLLVELLTDSASSFCCLQNYGYSSSYFAQIFKHTKIQDMMSLKDYLCPVANTKHIKNLIAEEERIVHLDIGFVVNSTPNDEQLHINSDHINHKEEGLEAEDIFKQKERNQHYSQILRSYGVLIHDLCEVVNDGVIVYFPTKDIMKQCRAEWEVKEKIYERIYHRKKIFQQDDLQSINRANVAQFRKLCDLGRGAVFFLAADSEFGKFQTFFKHYSRCVIFVGLPYPSLKIEAELKFKQLISKSHHKFQVFCFQEAMKTVARCLSNCSNDPNEVKVIIFADSEFSSHNLIYNWLQIVQAANENTSSVVEKVSFQFMMTQQLVHKRFKQQKSLIHLSQLGYRSP